MSKRYRLKKDLPGVSAGVELVPTSAMAYGYLTQGQWVHLEWVNDIIRANPDWFEEIKEEPKEVFTWDDKLACEWAGYLEERLKLAPYTDIRRILHSWKEKKQSKTTLTWSDRDMMDFAIHIRQLPSGFTINEELKTWNSLKK